MAHINAHPYKGFLNTNFQIKISDCSGSKIEIKHLDDFDESSFFDIHTDVDNITFTPRYPGTYQVLLKGKESARFVVEDAKKFGGSLYKKAYVFDKIPWCFLVMKDRTYFYNRNTSEQYAESISPDDIVCISNGLATFSNKDKSEETLYSLELQKPILHYTNKLILSDTLLVCKNTTESGSLSLDITKFTVQDGVLEKNTQTCNAFSVASDKQSVYFAHGDVISKINNDGSIVEVDKKDYQYYMKHFSFCGFVGNDFFIRSLDERYFGCEFRIVNMISKKSYFLSFNYTVELSIGPEQCVGTKSIDLKEDMDKLDTLSTKISEMELSNKTFLEYHSFTLSEFTFFSGDLYYIMTEHIVKISKYGHKIHNDVYKLKSLKNKENIDLKYVYNKISIDGNELHVRDCMQDYVLNDNKLEPTESQYHNKIQNYNNRKDGMPMYPEHTVSTSETGLYAIIEEGTHVYLAKRVGIASEHLFNKQEILLGLYDSSTYGNVFLSDNGDNIIYQNGDEMILMDLYTKKTESFPNLKFINHINGYRPLVSLDKFRRPIIINPLNGQNINNEFASQYTFNSPDGEYYADTNLDKYIKYYSYLSASYITKEEYSKFKMEYHTNLDMDESVKEKVKQNRAALINIHPELFKLKEGDKGEALLNSNIFFNYIVEKRGFAIIRKTKNDQIVAEIPLGPVLWFLNYVSFSFNSGLVVIAGRYPNNTFDRISGDNIGGLLMVYNILNNKIVVNKRDCDAVWTAVFTPDNRFGAYSSEPTTYIGDIEKENKIEKITKVEGKSFLTFSPNGHYLALSDQGYICYDKDKDNWGHQPSTNLYIAKVDEPTKIIAQYSDLADAGINGQNISQTIASCSFSVNNKKIIMVGNDKTVVIRNLHLT